MPASYDNQGSVSAWKTYAKCVAVRLPALCHSTEYLVASSLWQDMALLYGESTARFNELPSAQQRTCRNPDITHDMGGACIGDVGYLQEGAFIRLFSVANYSVSAQELEHGYNPSLLEIGSLVTETRRHSRVVHSRTVTMSEPSVA
jgi:hypothetical protein